MDADGLESAEVPDAAEETLEIPEWLQLLRQGEGEEPAETTGEEDSEAERPTDEQPVNAGEPSAESSQSDAILGYESTLDADPKNHTTRWELIQTYANAEITRRRWNTAGTWWNPENSSRRFWNTWKGFLARICKHETYASFLATDISNWIDSRKPLTPTATPCPCSDNRLTRVVP